MMAPKSLTGLLGAILRESSFLRSLRMLKQMSTKSRLFNDDIRQLTASEISELRSQGNKAQDWSMLFVTSDFTPENIEGCMFRGRCVLGAFRGAEIRVDDQLTLPTGIYNTTLVNSEIGDECLIYHTGLINNFVIKTGCVVSNTNRLSAGGNICFGNGRPIRVGMETGGREVLSYAELTIAVAASVAMRQADSFFIKTYDTFVKSYTDACRSGCGVLEPGAVVRDTGRIVDSYIGANVVVTGAVAIENSTVLGSKEEPTLIDTGSLVRNSCLQWGAQIRDMAIVDESVITEHAQVSRHAKVTHSIIGPNTGIAEGEVTSSLVGPFVGFHHQSLLIAALWPDGRGNIGYGANVGSNHTGKAPDQEIWCGEGIFFGLGCNIKYPTNFADAPYSIIATGVTCAPQRVIFPFSLINQPLHAIIPIGVNEIFPGWVLAKNMYAIRRSESKYATRNKARRLEVDPRILRPAIVDKMVAARNLLTSVRVVKEMYTHEDIDGLGSNACTEQSRKQGVEAYARFIEYYALTAFFNRVLMLINLDMKEELSSIFTTASDDYGWEHARLLCVLEGWCKRTLAENLRRFAVLELRIADDARAAKERDDLRGEAIIPDHARLQTTAGQDPIVAESKRHADEIAHTVEDLISRM